MVAVASFSRLGPDAADLASSGAMPPGFHHAPEPTRPEAVDAGAWRRMSRLSRMAVDVGARVVGAASDRASIPLTWGTAYGEFSSTTAFLRTLHARGPAGASPLHFQNAVHNAPAGHLSIGLGLHGPSETLCAGEATAFRAVERAMVMLALGAPEVLVVVADELGPDVQTGLQLGLGPAPYGEGAAALVLSREVGLGRAAVAIGEGGGVAVAAAPGIGQFPAAPLVALVGALLGGGGEVAAPGGRFLASGGATLGGAR